MNQSRQEHLKRAAEQIKKAKEFEAIKEKEYYEKITSGTRWKIFTFFTFFCVLLALLTTVDTFVDGKVEDLPFIHGNVGAFPWAEGRPDNFRSNERCVM